MTLALSSDIASAVGPLRIRYMAWRAEDTNNIFVSHSANGLDWSAQYKLPDAGTRSGVALSPVSRMLYMIGRGSSQDNLWTSILGT